MASSPSPAHGVVLRTCPLCEAHCGIRVEVDREARRIRRITGDPEDPMSRGYLCPKAHGLIGLHEDPDRLRRPLPPCRLRWRRPRSSMSSSKVAAS